MNFDMVQQHLNSFFIHTCWIEDKSSVEDGPGGEEIQKWTPRGGEGSETVFKCRREEVEVLSPFAFINIRGETGAGINTKLIRLFLEGDVSIISNVRISNINGDGKVYEISSDYDLVADEGSGTADTQEVIIEEILDA